jgi:hypothetical protein
MTKRFVGAVTLAAGLTFLPVTVRSSDQAKTPTLAMSDACAETENCCFSLGDFCMLGGKLVTNYRPAIGTSCGIKPGF